MQDVAHEQFPHFVKLWKSFEPLVEHAPPKKRGFYIDTPLIVRALVRETAGEWVLRFWGRELIVGQVGKDCFVQPWIGLVDLLYDFFGWILFLIKESDLLQFHNIFNQRLLPRFIYVQFTNKLEKFIQLLNLPLIKFLF